MTQSIIVPLAGITFGALCATTTIDALAGPEPPPCWKEIDSCSVCWHAGANILCAGGAINCPDEIIGNDAPFREVVKAGSGESGQKEKRSENYGSCQWQPKKDNPEGEGRIDDGPPREELNVMGEEIHGGTCTGEVGED